jgi:hypothetical protein
MLSEAWSYADWPGWKAAMGREVGTLRHAGTWEMVPRLAGENVVGSKWVLQLKCKADGSYVNKKVQDAPSRAWLHAGPQGGLFRHLFPCH